MINFTLFSFLLIITKVEHNKSNQEKPLVEISSIFYETIKRPDYISQ